MKSKFAKTGFIILIFMPIISLAQLSGASLFQEERLGKCYASLREIKRDIFGPEEDSNIIVRPAPIPAGIWIIDQTPATNFSWYLVESKNKQKCITLHIPFATQVVITKDSVATEISADTQAAPGYPGFKMTFRRSAKLKYFVPFNCIKTASHEGEVDETIDCKNVGR